MCSTPKIITFIVQFVLKTLHLMSWGQKQKEKIQNKTWSRPLNFVQPLLETNLTQNDSARCGATGHFWKLGHFLIKTQFLRIFWENVWLWVRKFRQINYCDHVFSSKTYIWTSFGPKISLHIWVWCKKNTRQFRKKNLY